MSRIVQCLLHGVEFWTIQNNLLEIVEYLILLDTGPSRALFSVTFPVDELDLHFRNWQRVEKVAEGDMLSNH